MATGMRTTLTDTTAQKRVVADIVTMLDPRDIPLISMVGLNNESKFRFVNTPGTKYEWIEDTLSPTADQLAEALDNSETGVDVDNGAYFHVGDMIQVDSEYMWVSSISSNTLTVTRGAAGTSAASHDDDSAVYIRYNARLEGADSDNGHTTEKSAPYNYAQILHDEILISGTAQVIEQYGISDEYNYQLMKKMGGAGGGKGKKGNAGELMLDLERVAFYGKRVLRTSSVASGCGGLDVFITTNTAALASAALTQKRLEDSIQTAWSYGGKPDCIVCNAWVKRKISSFYAGSIRTERRDDVGGMVIDTVSTEFGDLDILLDRHCPSGTAYILQKDKVGYITIRPFDHEELAKTGDWTKGQVLGEYGFVVENEKAHAIISGISTSK
jgi:hypothetical protein